MRVEVKDSICMIIDVQEKLFPHMFEKDILLENIPKLVNGLKLFKIDFILNEQYPKGLGVTIEPLKELLKDEVVYEKLTFSAYKNDVKSKLNGIGKKTVILFGIETHICLLQTVLDLLEENFIPIVVTDCVSSRKEIDKTIALQRMAQTGAILTTYESLLFELCQSAKNEVFKEISKIVK